ncbi:MAG: DUF1343 domain-containing protein [Acidobacteriota bacterium]
MIRTGLDSLLLEPRPLTGRRYGLLSNAAARNRALEPIHLALISAGAERPAVLFGPEHGFYGIEQDMVASGDERDPWTELPIVSLYGDSANSLVPSAEIFTHLDLLVVDLQDIGSRYYTYAASALWAAKVALEQGCEVWFLDRPNPLGGLVVEGNLPRLELHSFVGAFQLPVRHGLTLGELAKLESKRSDWPDGMRIWPVENWSRDQIWSDLNTPWVAPSPNLPTFEGALLYPGLCLIEGTELSEGRGTTRPFQLVGAPGVDPQALSEELRGLDLPGVCFVPSYFRPQAQKHAGLVCGGVEIRVTDPDSITPYRCGVELIAAVHRVAPDHFAWRRRPYEFVSEHPAIDLLTGDSIFRQCLSSRTDLAVWIDSWADDETEFREECEDIRIYPEGGDR